METEILNLIQSVGFPIAITLWFMFRTEKIINANTLAIIELTQMVKELQNGKHR